MTKPVWSHVLASCALKKPHLTVQDILLVSFAITLKGWRTEFFVLFFSGSLAKTHYN